MSNPYNFRADVRVKGDLTVDGTITGDVTGSIVAPSGGIWGGGILAVQPVAYDDAGGVATLYEAPAGSLVIIERAYFVATTGFDGTGAALTCGVTGGDVDGFLALTDISSGGPQGANDDELGALLWDSANSHKRVSLAGAATVLEFNLTQGTTPTTGQGVLLIYGSLVELPEL